MNRVISNTSIAVVTAVILPKYRKTIQPPSSHIIVAIIQTRKAPDALQPSPLLSALNPNMKTASREDENIRKEMTTPCRIEKCIIPPYLLRFVF